MKRTLKLAIIGAVIASAILIMIGAKSQDKPLTVSTRKVITTDIYNSVLSSGVIEDMGQTKVQGRGIGVVTKVYVREGQSVVKGQALFETALTDSAGYSFDGSEIEAAAQSFDITSLTELLNGIGDTGSQDGYAGYIVSPCDGIVTELKIQEGGFISASTNCVTISDMSDLYVRVSISEGNVADLALGMPVDITGKGFKDKTYKGVLTQIMPVAKQLSSLTGTGETVVEAIVAIKQPDELLKPGYTADVKIFTTRKLDTIVIPYEAIRQDENNVQMVFVNENGICKKKVITTGYELEDYVEVVTGLHPGHEIILNPDRTIKEGVKVLSN